MPETLVIVGGGHAAGQAIASLRQQKYRGRIVLIGEETHPPYQRPPLSKKYLAGDLPAERLYVKPAAFYDAPDIEVRPGTRVTAIDRDRCVVATEDGAETAWDVLLLATGSRVRRLPGDEALPAGIHYLRNIADVDAIRADFAVAKRLVIIGAGYIGLEVAAVARTLGLDVTVVEMAERVMSRVVSPAVSAFYESVHRAHGVDLRLGTGLAGFAGRPRVRAVITAAGEEIPADVVVVGVGIVPNVELAVAAGLAVDDGIVVDAGCRTSDARIYAIGDCTSQPSAIYGRRVRLESVPNALEQARTAAGNLCGGDLDHAEVPWFWSDQYDLKLQIAGLSQGYDAVIVRGSPADRAFSCLYLRDGRLLAIDAINAPRDFMQAKALIASGACPDPARAGDAASPLKDLAG